MENFALIGIAENLRPLMEGLIIRRVIQHQPHGFILQTRSNKLPALKIVMTAQNPAFYPSEAKPPLESTGASDFLMVLRKHFTSAELVEFRKPLSERVLEFVFRTAVPSKELETMSLVVELIPNAPNIVLLDAERRVLTSLNAITPQHGIGEYETYALPQSGDKISLERIVSEELPELQEPRTREWLVSHIAGLGPVFAEEILFRHKKDGRPLAEEIRLLIREVEARTHAARIYTEKPLGHLLEQNDLRAMAKAIVSPVELLSLERTRSAREFANITEAAKFYCDEMETRTLLEQAKLPLMRELRTASKRLSEREKRLLREQTGYENAEQLQKTGQLLNSSGQKLDQRYEAVTVTDYFQEKPQDLRIELDNALTLRENIDKMFKRHQKAGRGTQMVARQLSGVRSRAAGIAEQVRRLQAIKDWDTWLAISESITKGESAPPDPTGPMLGIGGVKGARRYRSLIVEGYEILVGRSSRENDELTFRVANADDFWMHVGDYSGSHVVVRNPSKARTIPNAVLTKAAQLAGFFSQARNSSKVEVHYTQRKFVGKPRRAKPGLVKLTEFKSISVEPKNWLESE